MRYSSRQHCDSEGIFVIRYSLFVIFKTDDRTFKHSLVNLYAPNKDEPNYSQKVTDYTLDFACDDIIIGFHFNVLDVNKDKKGENPTTHHKSVQKINEIIDNLDLTDIWTYESRFT